MCHYFLPFYETFEICPLVQIDLKKYQEASDDFEKANELYENTKSIISVIGNMK